MKIASAQLQMASSHISQSSYESRESLRVWIGERGARQREAALPTAPATDRVILSEAGREHASAESINDDIESSVDNDPRLKLIRNMLELLTGQHFRVFDAARLSAHDTSALPDVPQSNSMPANPSQPGQNAGYGIEYDRHESYSEMEQSTFSASGTVTTADGQTISFNLELSMSRTYHEESHVSLRLGDAARQTDPLVLNFAGHAAQLTDQRFAFDLDADGNAEQINFVKPGSGFLVFDRNQDGVVNNGSELFGPISGDGFSELAALDADQNGWIDENDATFSRLQVWSRDSTGNNQLQSLTAAGIGAIALSQVGTPFDIKNNANELLGQVRSTGIFLHEDASAGTIQQIDLTA
ncbi:MAG: VCBS repeat-containing protein [Azonexus sp.]